MSSKRRKKNLVNGDRGHGFDDSRLMIDAGDDEGVAATACCCPLLFLVDEATVSAEGRRRQRCVRTSPLTQPISCD